MSWQRGVGVREIEELMFNGSSSLVLQDEKFSYVWIAEKVALSVR